MAVADSSGAGGVELTGLLGAGVLDAGVVGADVGSLVTEGVEVDDTGLLVGAELGAEVEVVLEAGALDDELVVVAVDVGDVDVELLGLDVTDVEGAAGGVTVVVEVLGATAVLAGATACEVVGREVLDTEVVDDVGMGWASRAGPTPDELD